MTGRELLEALLKMDPADLELEVVARHTDSQTQEDRYMAETTLRLERVPRQEVPLLSIGKPRNEVVKIITIG